MLNRLYIVIGALAIFVLAAGFVAPRFIDWTSYRARLETLVETNLGAEVTIAGDFSFSLLPQPLMKIGKTLVGPAEQPFLEIESLEAEFSLMDFLRDRFVVTRLQINSPKIYLELQEDGSFDLPFELPEETSATNVSVASANIDGGQMIVTDARTQKLYKVEDFEGVLRISGISGPFSLQGQVLHEERSYSARMSLSELNDASQANLAFVLSPSDSAFLMTVEALATLGAAPSIDGEVALRVEREQSDTELGAQGDLIMVSEIKADATQILLPAFTLQPDENRPATRLTGAISILLGATPSFDAVFSGGVVGLAPRDVLDDEQEKPYPIIELLAELTAPIILPIPGRLGVDVAELDLQVFALRNVRLDAYADENGWRVDEFFGQLPGATQLSLTGRFDNVEGSPAFDGTFGLQTRRMDALGRLWSAGENSVLFDVPTSLSADLSFADQRLGMANGQFEIDGGVHSFAGLVGVGDNRSALLSARFSALDRLDSEILGAIIPPLDADSDIWRSFPSGSIDVATESAVLFDVAGEGLAAQLDWADGALNIERLSARNWGGAQIDFKGKALGTVLDPNISGSGFLRFADSNNAELLVALLAAQGANASVEELAFSNLPMEFNITAAPKSETGEQTISALGRVGVADVAFDASFSSGLFNISASPMQLSGSLSSAEPDLLAQQFGLQFTPLSVDARTNVQLFLDGTATNSFQLTVSAEGGDDHLAYGGSLNVSDPDVWSGSGRLDFGLSEPSASLALLGVDLPYMSAASGAGEIIFTGRDAIALNDLKITDAEGTSVATGQFNLSQTASTRLAVGQVAIVELDHADVWAMLFGPAALINGDSVFPDGPIDIGISRQSRALIDISVDRIFKDDAILARNFSANLSVNSDGTDLRNISAEIGGGNVEGSISVCCANLVSEKQVEMRASVSNLALNRLLPAEAARLLSGEISGSLSVSGTGGSLDQVVRSLNGSGSFVAKSLLIAGLDPAAFSSLDSVVDLTEVEPEQLVGRVTDELESGPLAVNELTGVIRVVGGRASANNLSASNGLASLFGDVELNIASGDLSGEWVISPVEISTGQSLLTPSSARIFARLSGTLSEPTRDVDVDQMVDAMQVRALEIELERLEALRAQQEARARVAAEERALQIAVEAERQAAEAQRRVEQAAQEARSQQLAEEIARQALEQPLNFNFESQDPLLQFEAPTDLIN